MSSQFKAVPPTSIHFVSAEGSSHSVDETINCGQALEASVEVDGTAVSIWLGLSHAGELWVMAGAAPPDGVQLSVPGAFNGQSFPHVILQVGRQVVVPVEAPVVLVVLPSLWPLVLLQAGADGSYIAQCNFSMITFVRRAD